MAQMLGTLGTVPYLKYGDIVFADLPNLITVGGSCNGASQVWSTLGENFTAAYQIPADKTLYIYAADVTTRVAEATIYCSIGYGDDSVGETSAVAPTNPKYVAGSDGNNISQFPATTVGKVQYNFAPLRIPTGKYPFIVDSAAATTVKLWAYFVGYLV